MQKLWLASPAVLLSVAPDSDDYKTCFRVIKAIGSQLEMKAERIIRHPQIGQTAFCLISTKFESEKKSEKRNSQFISALREALEKAGFKDRIVELSLGQTTQELLDLTKQINKNMRKAYNDLLNKYDF